ncbi:MAG: SDR family oxidoreductase [Armatimonadetes bacterium]|nr:SDR family oxidoreductase [Armatimonadota bacterium]MDW8120702.1 SDR family oxidoreductase [Armatimonadota bacterium]
MGVLNDKVALVTGAARGIGRAVAKAFSAEGAFVFLVDRDADSVKATAGEMKACGWQVVGLACDISDEEQVRELFEQVCQIRSPVHILVNNAGVQTLEPLLEKKVETWDRTIAINLRGPFLCTQAFARQVGDEGGVIINVASALAFRPVERYADYIASKAGLIAFTKASALELAPLKIRVNAIVPTITRTELNREVFADASLVQSIMDKLLVKKIAEPDDYASAFIFLASDASQYMTGQVLFLDGGYLTT